MSQMEVAIRVFWVLIGPFAGLYVATFAAAWPRWPRPLVGRSRCDRCHAPLRAVDQIPVLSYALKSGRRGCCDGRIPRTFPLGEGGGLGVGLIAALWPQPLLAGLAALLGFCFLYLGLVDLRRYRLPIPALGLAAALALGLRVLTHGSDLPVDLLGAALVVASMLLLRRLGPGRGAGLGMGAGDVVLAGVVALLAGWRLAPLSIALAALAPLPIMIVSRRRGPVAFGFWLSLVGCITLISVRS
jgi:leader peptidase (prepilin peptidase)/N-methyltransferase